MSGSGVVVDTSTVFTIAGKASADTIPDTVNVAVSSETNAPTWTHDTSWPITVHDQSVSPSTVTPETEAGTESATVTSNASEGPSLETTTST